MGTLATCEAGLNAPSPPSSLPGPTVLEEEYKTQRAPSKDETVGGAPFGLQGDPLRPPLSSYLEI